MEEKNSNLVVIFTALIGITLMVGELTGGVTASSVSDLSGKETIYFSHFGNGGGLRSEILLVNPSDSDTILVCVEFYDDGGQTLSIDITVSGTDDATPSIQTDSSQCASSNKFPIAPLGSLTLSTDGTGEKAAVGSAIVSSDESLGGVIRYSIEGMGIAGVGASESLDSFIIPVTRKKDVLNTGIALLNVEQTPVSVTLSLNNQNGEQVPGGSVSIVDLSPLGHQARFISELFPEAETEEFLGTLTGTVAGGKVAATALELGVQPGEFTTLPVTPSDLFGKETVILGDGSYVCRPAGVGPFPVVLYNHGGLGNAIGGDLEGTCEALATAGYLARSEKRRETVPLDGHLEDVVGGLSELLSHPDADSSRVTLLGFSRGGLLTLQAAVENPNQIHSIVLMAPAPGGNDDMQTTLENIAPLKASALIMVAENDLPPAQATDHVQLSEEVSSTLRIASKTVTMILYPPFSTDGHDLFDEVREPYWSHILAFLETESGL